MASILYLFIYLFLIYIVQTTEQGAKSIYCIKYEKLKLKDICAHLNKALCHNISNLQCLVFYRVMNDY